MADQIFLSGRDPVDAIPHIAVAYMHGHVGIVFRDKKIRRLWHLAQQHQLLLQDAPEALLERCYVWAIPTLGDAIEYRAVANFCASAANKKQMGGEFPFAFRYVPDEYRYVDDAMQLEGLIGFTCATFVLSIFDSLEYSLLDYFTWLPRDTDGERQQHLLEHVTKEGAAPEHVAALSEQIPALRFAPSEVAGACLEDIIPVSLPIAERRGRQIDEAQRQHFRRRFNGPH